MKDTFVNVKKGQGQNIPINFFIIRCMYSHLECINDAFKQNVGKRKRKDVLSEIFAMNSRKFNDILKSDGYRYYAKDVEKIAKRFNIDERYVIPNGVAESNGNILNGKIIELNDISEEDWKIFLNNRRSPTKKKQEEKDIHTKRIEAELKNICKKNYVERHYGKDHVLYAIYYYLTYNEIYDSEKKVSVAMRFMEGLKMSDWQEMSNEELDRYKNIISKHYRMVDAIQCYRENKTE